MKDEDRYALYEKLYFHEVDARDKVAARLQIPLALLFSVLSIFAVLIKGMTSIDFENWQLLFYGFFIASVIFFIISSAYFIGAFYNHSYLFMPAANEIEDYRLTLIKHYEPYDDAENYVDNDFKKFIYGHYNRCSTANVKVNDRRSYRIHMCNRYLIFSALPLLISFLFFTLADVEAEKKYIRLKLKGQ